MAPKGNFKAKQKPKPKPAVVCKKKHVAKDDKRVANDDKRVANDDNDADVLDESLPKPPQDFNVDSVDGKWLSKIAVANSEIMQWEECESDDTPLTISEGGVAEAYAAETVREAMSKESGNVTVLGLLDWLNPTCNLSGVSLNIGSVAEMSKQHFPKNDGTERIPFTFVIAVTSS